MEIEDYLASEEVKIREVRMWPVELDLNGHGGAVREMVFARGARQPCNDRN